MKYLCDDCDQPCTARLTGDEGYGNEHELVSDCCGMSVRTKPLNTYLITIDRSSSEIELKAASEEEAEKEALAIMAGEYKTPLDTYDFWVADTVIEVEE